MKTFWSLLRQHGTKALGYLIQALGLLAVSDPTLIASMFGPRGMGVIVLLLGFATLIRGHTNTAAIKDEIRVEEIAKEEVKVQDAVDEITDARITGKTEGS